MFYHQSGARLRSRKTENKTEKMITSGGFTFHKSREENPKESKRSVRSKWNTKVLPTLLAFHLTQHIQIKLNHQHNHEFS